MLGIVRDLREYYVDTHDDDYNHRGITNDLRYLGYEVVAEPKIPLGRYLYAFVTPVGNTFRTGKVPLLSGLRRVSALDFIRVVRELRSIKEMIMNLRGHKVLIPDKHQFDKVQHQLHHYLDEGYIGYETPRLAAHDTGVLIHSDKRSWRLHEAAEPTTSFTNFLRDIRDIHLRIQQYKMMGQPVHINEEGAIMPETTVFWKNPKPRIKNKRPVKVGDVVVIDGKPLLQQVDSVNGDNVYITTEVGPYNISDVFPLFGRADVKNVAIGDIIDLGVSSGLVTSVHEDHVMAGDQKVTFDHLKDRVIYSTKPETQLYNLHTCGTIEYNGGVWNSLKELKADNPGIKFKSMKVAVDYKLAEIAKHYNVDIQELVANDAVIHKEVSKALDHPVNVQAKEWAMLVGPSGGGKTTAAISYAKDVERTYVKEQGSAQMTVDDLKGYKSVTTGEYFPSLLRQAVEKGYVYILDEIDACNTNTLIALNDLKSEEYQFPDALVPIHKDFRFIATANTLEYSEEYNARSPLDKASKLRFKVIKCDLTEPELAIRYGLKYIKRVENIDRKAPREIEREVNEMRIDEEDE